MNDFSAPDSFQLPSHLAAIYEIKSCLKYTDSSATYLLRKRSSGQLYLLKTASDPVFARLLSNEKQMLEFIHQQENTEAAATFPIPVYLSIPDDAVSAKDSGNAPGPSVAYYIRTYINGKTLEELCETNYKKPGLSRHRALDCLIALTELLQFLHELDPPLIHRDIKPQNVVIDPEGVCHFIDLGISRFYHPDKQADTFIMGTRLTAPPEQFGYQQTDTRSDLYSLGVLLFYSLTGEYKLESRSLEELPPELQRIIRCATMFDPERRYQNTRQLLCDLLSVRYPGLTSTSAHKQIVRYRAATALLVGLNLTLTTALLHQNRKASEDHLLPEQITENTTAGYQPAAKPNDKTMTETEPESESESELDTEFDFSPK